MRLLKRIHFWLGGLFGRRRFNADLDAEMRMHLELRAEKNMAAGMSPRDAHDAALRAFGGLDQLKERARDQRGGVWIGHLSQDLRFGGRMLRKNPTFTAIAILSLALGIGAATSAFWMYDAIFLESLPVPSPQDLRVICWSGSDTHFSWHFSFVGEPVIPGRQAGSSFSKDAFFTLRRQCAAQADIFAYAPFFMAIARAKGHGVSVDGRMVSGNFFSALGVRPVLGSVLGPEDESPTAAPRVVISYRWWDREFGLDPNVVGQQVTINGVSYAVVGVLPPEFTGVNPGSKSDLFVSLSAKSLPDANMPAVMWTMPDGYWIALMGRLKPGVSTPQFQAVLDVALKSAVGKAITDPLGVVADGRDGPVWNRVDLLNKLRLLLAVIGVVLLAACVNIAGLLIARGAARQHELSLRGALGAGRGRLVRQLLTESTLLSALGGGLGVLFAFWGKIVVSQFLAGSPEGVQYGAALDFKVLGFALAVTLLTVLLAGLFPALKATRVDARNGVRNSSAIGTPRLRAGQTLVVAQIALSLLLVTGAGLYARTLINLDRIDPGYAMDHLLFLVLNPGAAGYRDSRAVTYYENVQHSLAAIPGVQSAALVSFTPLGGLIWNTLVTIPGLPTAEKNTTASALTVDENFFGTMGIPILDGREFRAGDKEAAAKVVVVNEAFVRRFMSGRPPIGRMVKSGDADWRLVGVCRDTKYSGIKQAIQPTIYFPFRQQVMGRTSFALRTTVPPMAVAEEAQKAVNAIDPAVPATDLSTEVQLRDQGIATERACARYYGSLAGFVLLLSCMGLYGLMAFDVARRTGEFGIRLALGANSRQIVRPILRMALWLAFAGFVAGLPLALVLTRYIRANLYGVTTTDPLTFLGSAMLLVVVMLAAAWIPARRATRVDPMVALRCE